MVAAERALVERAATQAAAWAASNSGRAALRDEAVAAVDAEREAPVWV